MNISARRNVDTLKRKRLKPASRYRASQTRVRDDRKTPCTVECFTCRWLFRGYKISRHDYLSVGVAMLASQCYPVPCIIKHSDSTRIISHAVIVSKQFRAVRHRGSECVANLLDRLPADFLRSSSSTQPATLCYRGFSTFT